MRLVTTGMICATLALSACGQTPLFKQRPAQDATPPAGTVRPQARPEGASAPKPAANARTAEQFDTTTAEERKKAAAPVQTGGEKALGETVASLGDPAKPGFWLETPLVSTAQTGRVLYLATGKTVQVDLIPIDGPKDGGSRLSLAAMRLIDAPLTGLPKVQVFAGG
ncbi:hypothetical protein [Antarctobacter jejuensis]|uniref:hypothetical protein n=1 Tax=Antarctobacter jejuensis TaxID=1439938 RepID=UPI003FD4BBD3